MPSSRAQQDVYTLECFSPLRSLSLTPSLICASRKIDSRDRASENLWWRSIIAKGPGLTLKHRYGSTVIKLILRYKEPSEQVDSESELL